MKISTLIVAFCLLISPVTFADTVKAPSTDPPGAPRIAVDASKSEIERKVRLALNDPRMMPILYCESGFNQYNRDGKPLISPTKDVGIGQVNKLHWKRAKDLGLDIFNDINDNLKMVNIIYKEQGIEAWSTYGGNCYKKHLYLI